MDVKEQNALNTTSGTAYQKQIFEYIKSNIFNPNILVYQPHAKIVLPGSKSKSKRFSCLEIWTPIGRFVGDNDIVIFNTRQKQPVIIVSVKTSLRERYTQSCYNARLYREARFGALPFFLVTKDYKFGTEQKPNKARIILTYEKISVYSDNQRTSFGGNIKSIRDLIPDIQGIL